MKTIWVLIVFVVADGQWREWNSYSRQSECEEVISVITHRREDKIIAVCESREIGETKDVNNNRDRSKEN